MLVFPTPSVHLLVPLLQPPALLTRYCCLVPPHPRPFVAFQAVSEFYPSSIVLSFNSFLLILRRHFTCNSVSQKYHEKSQARCSRLIAAIIGIRHEFWFFNSGKQDFISTKTTPIFIFTKCHLFWTYIITAQSR